MPGYDRYIDQYFGRRNTKVVSDPAKLQAAIDAAIQGTTILLTPGAYDVDVTNKAGVTIRAISPKNTFVRSITNVPGGVVDVYPDPPAMDYIMLPLPGDMPLVAVHHDDINKAGWFNTNAAYGGISAAQYVIDKAIPITHGTICGWIDNEYCFSKAQIRQLFLQAGHEFISHTYSHGDTPTPAEVFAEIVSTKDFIESLSADFDNTLIYPGLIQAISGMVNGGNSTAPLSEAYWKQLGMKCRGFSNPGTWTYNSTPYTVLFDHMNTRAGHCVYEAIKAVFEWNAIYGEGVMGQVTNNIPRDFGWMGMQQFYYTYVQPGLKLEPNTRLHLISDGPGSSVLPHATYAAIINYLYDQRQTGNLMVVTGSTLRRGIVTGKNRATGLPTAIANLPVGELPANSSITAYTGWVNVDAHAQVVQSASYAQTITYIGTWADGDSIKFTVVNPITYAEVSSVDIKMSTFGGITANQLKTAINNMLIAADVPTLTVDVDIDGGVGLPQTITFHDELGLRSIDELGLSMSYDTVGDGSASIAPSGKAIEMTHGSSIDAYPNLIPGQSYQMKITSYMITCNPSITFPGYGDNESHLDISLMSSVVDDSGNSSLLKVPLRRIKSYFTSSGNIIQTDLTTLLTFSVSTNMKNTYIRFRASCWQTASQGRLGIKSVEITPI